jgi:hypothetical protein
MLPLDVDLALPALKRSDNPSELREESLLFSAKHSTDMPPLTTRILRSQPASLEDEGTAGYRGIIAAVKPAETPGNDIHTINGRHPRNFSIERLNTGRSSHHGKIPPPD